MAMTERHDDPVASGRPITTGEFRAARDISASTAQFRAFAEDPEFGRDPEVTAPGRSPAQVAVVIALVIVVLAIIALIAYEMKG
jgi:hypothetical protein